MEMQWLSAAIDFGVIGLLVALSIVVVAIRLVLWIAYEQSPMWQLEDLRRGFRREFPMARWAIAALVAWAWVIAGWTR